MERLYVVRSGSSAWEERAGAEGARCGVDHRRLQGTTPLPLSGADCMCLDRVGEVLRGEGIDVLYHSGNESSAATAVYLSKRCGLKCKKLAPLREVDCGLWQGLQIKEIKTRYGRAYRLWRNDPLSVCPPDGETIEAASGRVRDAMGKIRRKNKGKRVLVVAAPMVAGLIECLLGGSNGCGKQTGKNGLEGLWRHVDDAPLVSVFEIEHGSDEEGLVRGRPVRLDAVRV